MLHKAWNSKGEMPYCFPRSSIKFRGHTVQNITDFDPNWAFPHYRPVAAFKSLRFALFFIRWVLKYTCKITAIYPRVQWVNLIHFLNVCQIINLYAISCFLTWLVMNINMNKSLCNWVRYHFSCACVTNVWSFRHQEQIQQLIVMSSASEAPVCCVKIVVFIILHGFFVPCRKYNNACILMMKPTRVLFWCLFPFSWWSPPECYFGVLFPSLQMIENGNTIFTIPESTHCDLVMPYGDIDLGQFWLR